MTIDEELIRDALLRSSASDLDDILTAIEAYRMCVITAHRLHRTAGTQGQRDQALECAGYCRKVLQDYASMGRIDRISDRTAGEVRFTFVFS